MAKPMTARSSVDDLTEFSRRAAGLEHITAPEQIVALLKRVKEYNPLVTVTLPGSTQHFSSAILDIHPSESCLVLDELTSSDGHSLLLQADKVYIHAKLKGVELSFATRPGTLGHQAGIAYYRLPLPEKLIYRQRRSAYRVPLGGSVTVTVTLAKGDQGMLEGQLLDISLGGIGVQFLLAFGAHTRLALGLTAGDVIPYCAIAFPDDVRVSSRLEIRNIRHDLDRQVIRVGGRLLDLDREQRRIIESFVTMMDREQRKGSDR